MKKNQSQWKLYFIKTFVVVNSLQAAFNDIGICRLQVRLESKYCAVDFSAFISTGLVA